MKDTREYLRKLTNIIVKYKYVLIVAAVGLVLLVWPSGSDDKTNTDSDTAVEKTGFDTDISEVENKLAELLGKVDGVGRVEVMLSLRSDMEYVYADEYQRSFEEKTSDGTSDSSISEKREYVTVRGKDGSEELVMIKRVYPEYRGAAIVCDGANNATVRLKVINAVSSVTGLSSDRITVMKMK